MSNNELVLLSRLLIFISLFKYKIFIPAYRA